MIKPILGLIYIGVRARFCLREQNIFVRIFNVKFKGVRIFKSVNYYTITLLYFLN